MVKVDFGFIDSVLEKYDCDKTRVIAIMQDVQAEYSFLPEDALRYIAEKVGESEAEIFGVATFYENFSMNERVNILLRSATARRATSESPTMSRRLFTRRPE